MAWLACFVGFLYLCSTVFASEFSIYVSDNTGNDANDGDSLNPLKSLAAALASASVLLSTYASIDIIVAPGLYTGVDNARLLVPATSVNISSSDGSDVTTIDCAHIGRAFIFNETTLALGPPSNIEGFTIQHCNATSDDGGGAIFIQRASPSIRNCKLLYNYATGGGGAISLLYSSSILSNLYLYNNAAGTNGGGLYAFFSDGSKLEESTIYNCSAGLMGGGFYLYKSSFTLTSTIVMKNRAGTRIGHGGGLYVFDSPVQIQNCTISENLATAGDGGGGYIYSSVSDSMSISSTSFLYNYCAGQGGGMYISAAAPIISQCDVTGNVAGGAGGGLNVYSSTGAPVITKCNLINNVGSSGGGIYISMNEFDDFATESVTTLSYCVVSGNTANGAGGGLFLSGSSQLTKLINSTFTNNIAASGSGGGVNLYNSLPSVSTCAFQNNSCTGSGGGIFVDFRATSSLSPLISNSSFLYNSATVSGGGLYYESAAQSSLISGNLTFWSNIANHMGGGIYVSEKSAPSNPLFDACNVDYNKATTGGGGAYINAIRPVISDSTFSHNEALCGNGGGALVSSLLPSFSRSSFLSNAAISCDFTGGNGGGISVEYSSPPSPMLTICTIKANRADKAGGGLYFVDSSPVLSNCLLDSNEAGVVGGGAAIFTQSEISTTVSFVDMIFTNNTAFQMGGGIAVQQYISTATTNVTLNATSIMKNKVIGQSNTYDSGGAGMYANGVTKVSVIHSNISGNILIGSGVANGGGSDFIGVSIVNIVNSTFMNNTLVAGGLGGRGGGISLTSCSSVYLLHTTISYNAAIISDNNTAVEVDGGGICLYSSKAKFENCEINHNSALADNIIDGTGNGGGIFVSLRSTVSVSNCTVNHNKASGVTTMGGGGGLFCQTDSSLVVSTSSFVANQASQCGAGIFLQNSLPASFINCNISKNIVTRNGGGICLYGSHATFIETTVVGNSATSGGAGYVDPASILYLEDSIVRNNNATYVGGIHALPPASVFQDQNTEIENFPSYYATAYVVLQAPFPSLSYPSSVLEPIVVVAMDYFGNFVEADSETFISFDPLDNTTNQNSFSVLSNQKTLKGGVAVFDSMVFTGNAKKNYTVGMTTSLSNENTTKFSIYLTGCPPGSEIDQTSTLCVECKYGWYNFNGEKCLPCPSGGVCEGGMSLLTSSEGFWRTNSYSSNFFVCPLGVCLGNDTCAAGYTGYLCSTCLPGKQKYGAECLECNYAGAYAAAAVFVLIVGAVFYSRGTKNPMFTIFVYFANCSLLMVVIDNKFSVPGYFNFVNLDVSFCLTGTYYQSFVLKLCVPFLLFFCIIAYHVINFFIIQKPPTELTSKHLILRQSTLQKISHMVMTATLSMLYEMYIPMSFTIVGYFSCEKVADKYLLRADYSVQCYTHQWWRYFVAALIFLIFYVAFVPIFYMWLIYRTRIYMQLQEMSRKSISSKQLQLEEPQKFVFLDLMRVSFLLKIFRPSHWYYGIVLMIRRLIWTLILVLGKSSLSSGYEMFMLCLFCLGFIIIHFTTKPFANKRANIVEGVVVIVHFLIAFVYLDLFNHNSEDPSSWHFALVVVLVIVGIVPFAWALSIYARNRFLTRLFLSKFSLAVTPETPPMIASASGVSLAVSPSSSHSPTPALSHAPSRSASHSPSPFSSSHFPPSPNEGALTQSTTAFLSAAVWGGEEGGRGKMTLVPSRSGEMIATPISVFADEEREEKGGEGEEPKTPHSTR